MKRIENIIRQITKSTDRSKRIKGGNEMLPPSKNSNKFVFLLAYSNFGLALEGTFARKWKEKQAFLLHFARLFVPLQARKDKSMQVVYEDNHIIIVNKESGEIVQGDKTGDRPLSEIVKDYI